jgi:hypothetical protein
MAAVALMPLQARTRSIQAKSAPVFIQVQSPPPLREDESLGGEAFRSIDRMREALSATTTGGGFTCCAGTRQFDHLVGAGNELRRHVDAKSRRSRAKRRKAVAGTNPFSFSR